MAAALNLRLFFPDFASRTETAAGVGESIAFNCKTKAAVIAEMLPWEALRMAKIERKTCQV